MATLPRVRDFMDKKVPTLTPEIPIIDAVTLLLDKGRTGAPVLDGDGKIIGMLTETDCLRLFAEGQPGLSATEAVVSDLMTRDVKTVPSDADIYYAAGLLLKHRFRRLPVVDEGKLVGAITRFDLLRVVRRMLLRHG